MRPLYIFLSAVLLTSAAALALPASDAPAGGPTIFIDETADELNNDGDCSLREAVKATRENVAVDGCPAGHFAGPDTIVLESGTTYALSIEGDGADEGDLNTGGASANPLFIRSEPGPGNAIIDANGIHRVLTVSFGGEVEIQNVTFTGGDAPPLTAGGGGIQNNGTLHLISVQVVNNSSPQSGGGIANRIDDTLVIEDSLIADNVASADGGGISNGGTLTVEGSIISGNTSLENDGGGISTSGHATVTDSTISDNHSLTRFGGGISNHGVLTVERGLITENTAEQRGGGLSNGATSNTENIRLTNVTVSGNTASVAGGINEQGEGVLIVNSTIAFNEATDAGRPNNLRSSFHGDFEVTNSIISSAGGPAEGNPDCTATIVSGGGNIASDDTCGLDPESGDTTGADPLLEPLADNGGPTRTHALMDGSLALSRAVQPVCPATDQRGVVRPQGSGCDIGAFESSLEPHSLIQGDNDCDTVDPGDPDVDAVDALKALQDVAALPYSQEPGCPAIGAKVASLFGDVDCDGDVDSVDALQVLRYVAALPVNQSEPCTDVGEEL